MIGVCPSFKALWCDLYRQAGGAATDEVDGEGGVDITFTATRAANGALLLGSSRELAGWEVRLVVPPRAHDSGWVYPENFRNSYRYLYIPEAPRP